MKKEEIFVNRSFWKNFDDNQINNFVEKIFQYYRMNGFPYYPTNVEYRIKEFQKFQNYDISCLINDNIIKQAMHGLGLSWSYFPHAFEVKCSNKLSPIEAFNSDEILKRVIKKRLKFGTYISNSGILKMLKLYSGVQSVSNFRPTAAAAIYKIYAPNGVVWDMSGGWGGRLFGAISSNVKYYHVSEPSIKTNNGLKEIVNDFKFKEKSEIYCYGSEDTFLDKESVDFCFTSPPYFDLEKYSNEDTQSYLKFKSKNEWINLFLRKTIENCYFCLRNGSHLAINISDPKKKNNLSLEDETIKLAKEIGFKHVQTLMLSLSNPVMINKISAFKYEPIFIFKK